MKYLILIKSNPEWRQAFADLDPQARAEGLSLYEGLYRELAESGELVDAEQLAGPETVKRVTSDGGDTVVSDGPYVELKEFLGGYYLVDVESFDRAVEIGARLPEAAHGWIEVVPILVRAGMGMEA